MKPRIGIIGMGFLGEAMVHGFILHAEIKIYDKYKDGYNTLEETVNESDYLFIGVPTPMKDNGEQDLSNLTEAIKSITSVAKTRKIIVIRSTVVPGTTRNFSNIYYHHDFVFSPEFLTERTSRLDYINTARIILAGDKDITKKIEEKVFRIRFPHTMIFHTSYEGAELVKYMCNCFFAVKISFMNEMFDMCERMNINFNEVKNMFLSDGRIGNSHIDVPGHDGQRGFGGKCFPKDIESFISHGERLGINTDMCKAAKKVNDRVRQVKDWFDIKGATSQNNYK